MGGNLYDKYNTRNRIAAYLMGRFLRDFDDLTSRLQRGTALEAGCGEGELIRRLSMRGWKTNAFDFSEEAIAEAKRRDSLMHVSTCYFIADVERAELCRADVVVCCEVLEHLAHPEMAIEKLSRVAPNAIFSVPREPLWRVLNMVRGAYWANFGNTPGHVQHWGATRFLAILEQEFDIVEVRRPVPWTMALCRSRRF